VTLFVPVVRFLIYSTYTTELYSSTVQKERADTNERTNERTTNEIPFNRKDKPHPHSELAPGK